MPDPKKSFTQGLISSITGRSGLPGGHLSGQPNQLQSFLGLPAEQLEGLSDDTRWLLGLLAGIMNNMAEGVIITDNEGKILAVNPAFTQVTGYTPEDAIGKRPNMLQSGRHDQDFFTQMWIQLLQKGAWQGEIWNRRKNGENYTQWLNIQAVTRGEGQPVHYIGVFTDITSKKEIEEKVHYLKTHDALTGLLNRQSFLDWLKDALAPGSGRSHGFGILLVHLNNFNQVIEQHGHKISDQLLRAVAMRLKFNLRPDDLAARWAVDEFAVIVYDVTDTHAAEIVRQRVVDKLNSSFDIKGVKIDLTCIGGYSLFPSDGANCDEMIVRASRRLTEI